MNTFLGSSFLGECNKCTPLQHIKGGLFLNWGKTHKKKLERFEIGIDNSPGATISVITIIISALQRVANSRISKTPLASAHATLFFFFFVLISFLWLLLLSAFAGGGIFVLFLCNIIRRPTATP